MNKKSWIYILSLVFFFTIVNSNCTHYSRVAHMYVSQGGIMRGAFTEWRVKTKLSPILRSTTDEDLLPSVGDDDDVRLKSIDHSQIFGEGEIEVCTTTSQWIALATSRQNIVYVNNVNGVRSREPSGQSLDALWIILHCDDDNDDVGQSVGNDWRTSDSRLRWSPAWNPLGIIIIRDVEADVNESATPSGTNASGSPKHERRESPDRLSCAHRYRLLPKRSVDD